MESVVVAPCGIPGVEIEAGGGGSSRGRRERLAAYVILWKNLMVLGWQLSAVQLGFVVLLERCYPVQ